MLSQKRLAELTGLGQGTVAKHVRRLRDDGIVGPGNPLTFDPHRLDPTQSALAGTMMQVPAGTIDEVVSTLAAWMAAYPADELVGRTATAIARLRSGADAAPVAPSGRDARADGRAFRDLVKTDQTEDRVDTGRSVNTSSVSVSDGRGDRDAGLARLGAEAGGVNWDAGWFAAWFERANTLADRHRLNRGYDPRTAEQVFRQVGLSSTQLNRALAKVEEQVTTSGKIHSPIGVLVNAARLRPGHPTFAEYFESSAPDEAQRRPGDVGYEMVFVDDAHNTVMRVPVNRGDTTRR